MLSHFQTRIALGSQATLTLVTDASQSNLDEIFRRLWLELFEFENRCSRFLPDSELSQFNRAAGGKQPISPEFRDILAVSRELAVQSNELYNPFILPALQRAGYVQSMVAAHSKDVVDDYADRGVAKAEQLEIGDTWARIPYGSAIDLGGSGKGYAADLLADIADTFPAIQGYWFSLGGDIIVNGLNEKGTPWIIGIEDTVHPNTTMAGQAVAPVDGRSAVATSSVLRRTGVKAGKAWHHIIDPRTGQPAVTDTATASIFAKTAVLADVLAKCALLLPSVEVEAYVRARGARGLLLQTKSRVLTTWGAIDIMQATQDHTSHQGER